jgi:hypothetical protein
MMNAATVKLVTPAKKTTPPARPSRPSIRLIALITPTNQSTVTGSASTPVGIVSIHGRATPSMRKPQANAKQATPIWASSLYAARTPRASS